MSTPALTHDLYVNFERTTLVRVWSDGRVEVARRESPADTWGPPEYLALETRNA
jgi:hypothetical protein